MMPPFLRFVDDTGRRYLIRLDLMQAVVHDRATWAGPPPGPRMQSMILLSTDITSPQSDGPAMLSVEESVEDIMAAIEMAASGVLEGGQIIDVEGVAARVATAGGYSRRLAEGGDRPASRSRSSGSTAASLPPQTTEAPVAAEGGP